MPTLEILRYQNPELNLDLLDRYRRIYHGGALIQESICDFLPKGFNESQAAYNNRCKNAMGSYEPHLCNIINNCDCELFAYPFDPRGYDKDGYEYQDDDGFFAKFKEDCSNGCDLKDFMRARFVHAMVYGNSYFILHYQDQEASLEAVSCFDVIDWQYDERGQLEYCVIRQEASKRIPLTKDREVTETFRIFDKESVSTYQTTYPEKRKPPQTTEVPLISKERHGFDLPPVLCLHLPETLALVPLAGEIQVNHFQMNHSLNWAMKQTNVPVPVYQTEDEEKVSQNGFNRERGLFLGQNDKFEYVTPDSSSFEQQNNRLKHLKDELYRVCNATALSIDQHLNGSVARSGESKELDAALREVGLNRMGAIVRECVETLFTMLSEARGEDTSWDVTGLDRFAIAIKGTTVDDSLKALDVLGQCSKTAKLEIETQLAEKVLAGLPQHTKFQIRAELAVSAEEANEPEEPELIQNQISQIATSLAAGPNPQANGKAPQGKAAPIAPVTTTGRKPKG